MASRTDSELLTVTVIESMLGNNTACTHLTKYKVTQIIDLFIVCVREVVIIVCLVANAS